MEEQLTTLLKQLTDHAQSTSPLKLSTKDLDLLSTNLTPSAAPRARSLAYLCLSKHAEIAAERRGPSTSTSSIDSVLLFGLTNYIQNAISDTRAEPILRSLALLTALFQVDSHLATALFNVDGVLDSLMDLVELPFFDSVEEAFDVRIATAEMLSAACGVSSLRANIQAKASGWLSANVTAKEDQMAEKMNSLKVISVVTLTKLSKAIQADPTIGQGSAADTSSSTTAASSWDLAEMLKAMVMSSAATEQPLHRNHGNLMTALEGLAYSSLEPRIKELLCNDSTFLRALCSLVTSFCSSTNTPRSSSLSPSYNLNLDARPADHTSAALAFGVVTILVNCLSRKPALSEEQTQMDQLRKMAAAGVASGGKKKLGEAEALENSPLETDDAVQLRVDKAIDAGVIEAAVILAKSDSLRVKEEDGRLFLAIVDGQQHRKAVLAKGGGKALLYILKGLMGETGDKSLADFPAEVLPTIQAMAKLAITTQPILLFGPDPSTSCLDYIRPLTSLLQHPTSSRLQHFEALMALTNLASIDPSVASRIIKQDGLMTEIETNMLDDNHLVQRAAVELVCNLMACDEGFTRYSGDVLPTAKRQEGLNNNGSKPRLQILLAMTYVDDMQTKLASSGALAALTQSPTTCKTLLALGGSASKLMKKMSDLLAPPFMAKEDDEDEDAEIEEVSTLSPDMGLIHRGSVVLANILGYAATLPKAEFFQVAETAANEGVVRRLLDLLGTWTSSDSMAPKPPQDVLLAVVECLKLIKSGGVDIAKMT